MTAPFEQPIDTHRGAARTLPLPPRSYQYGSPAGYQQQQQSRTAPTTLHPTSADAYLRGRVRNASPRVSPGEQSGEVYTEKPPMRSQNGTIAGDGRPWAVLMKQAGYQNARTKALGSAQNDDISRQAMGPFSWISSAFALSTLPRWLTFIIPIAGVLWVPGIVALTAYNARPSNNFSHPKVWSTGIFWWSCWLSSVWVGWWVCRAAAGFFPRLFKKFLGPISIGNDMGLRRIIDYVVACEKYLAIVLQSILTYALWLLLIWRHYSSPDRSAADEVVNPLGTGSTLTNSTITYVGSDSPTDSTTELYITISRFFFGTMLCSLLLFAEKLFIQVIAYSFHKVTYSQRLAVSQFQIAVLATLCRHARQSSRRNSFSIMGGSSDPPSKSTRSQDRRNKQAYTVLGATAFDLVADQYLAAGQNLEYVIINAFESPEETKKLSRRIFNSLSRKDISNPNAPTFVTVEDFAPHFPDAATTAAAFEVFDKDGNGNISREEMQASCLDIRYSRLTLIDSMHDVDSAVNSLDSGFMSIYTLLATVLIAAMLSSSFATLVTSLGTLVLGLSWLFAASAAETLAAILLLIVKHPYDTGDAIDVSDVCGSNLMSYTVAEMFLLSTTFTDSQGRHVQIANSLLAQKAILNHRRSGPCSEPFVVDLSYKTTLSQLEELRTLMITWLEGQGRDFLPGLDISITSLGDQSKLTISAGIRYKSNWQDPDLKARRRNRWICAFKDLLRQLNIFGPEGDPDGEKPVTKIAMVEGSTTQNLPHGNDDGGGGAGGEGGGQGYGHGHGHGGQEGEILSPAEYRLMDEERFRPGEEPSSGVQTGIGGAGTPRSIRSATGEISSSSRRGLRPSPLPLPQQVQHQGGHYEGFEMGNRI